MNDSHIFHSANGTRWKIIKLITAIIAAIIIAFGIYIVPRIFTTQPVTGFQSSQSNVTIASSSNNGDVTSKSIAAQIYDRNTPVIGSGPLIRVVKIVNENGKTVAVDPFTNKQTESIADQDLSKLDGYEYAIQQYGDTQGKRIALTFDDGPDPVYTPQILDLLAEQSAPSTFFTLGSNVAKHPDIAQRIEREGHEISNHSYSHKDFEKVDDFTATNEINLTQRVIRAATDTNPSFFRVPYGGNTEQSYRDSITGILKSQQLGYSMASYDFDTNDWQFESGFKPIYPELKGDDMVLLLHDAGGNRSHTIEYLKKFIADAKAKGYTFTTLSGLYPQQPELIAAAAPTLADDTTLAASQAVLVLPLKIITSLFIVTISAVFVALFLNVILASIQIKRSNFGRRKKGYNPKVTIVVPAYNEGIVLVDSVKSLLKSHYKNFEILIIDDGSTDDTLKIARQLARTYRKVRAIHQKNGGKASALNRALQVVKGEIIIGIDADTLFTPSTITRLTRHFIDPKVGAVAGSVKVGNADNIITTWQALEYIVSINIERNAQALLGSIMIVPGACGAWRKSAIEEAGGYSVATLAEDCDLTLSVHKLGYRVLQDNSAVAYTEAPESLGPFVKQRFRWMFGSLQALWKHRNMMFNRRFGWLGLFAMPNTAVAILIPILFMPLLISVTIGNIFAGRLELVLLFASITFALNFIIAVIGIRLAREQYRYLKALIYVRFIFGPVRIYLLYKTVLTALSGANVGWNKLQRSGAVTYAAQSASPTSRTVSKKRIFRSAE